MRTPGKPYIFKVNPHLTICATQYRSVPFIHHKIYIHDAAKSYQILFLVGILYAYFIFQIH